MKKWEVSGIKYWEKKWVEKDRLNEQKCRDINGWKM